MVNCCSNKPLLSQSKHYYLYTRRLSTRCSFWDLRYLVSGPAWHLDAFSASQLPTWLPSSASDETTGKPEVSSPRSSRHLVYFDYSKDQTISSSDHNCGLGCRHVTPELSGVSSLKTQSLRGHLLKSSFATKSN